MLCMRTIIVDLDGTLADVRHRLHHIRAKGRKNWDRFFEAMPDDPVNDWCLQLLKAMAKEGYEIAIVSGRPDTYENDVKAWLARYEVPYQHLYLRGGGDRRPDTIVKREILHTHFDKRDILFVVDDRTSVVKMWREEGLVCLQCDPHE
jgi:phosphoglycolate phosphatase-like HAD superfamily hydrolase